jgi:DNA primase
MGIVDEDIARVREATDLVAVASEHVALKRVGRQWQGLCPFHAEKTPSFYVNAELGVYHCWGCQAGGDAITFVREVEHLDFAEAVERLAAKAGIQLRYDDAVTTRDNQRKAKLREATAAACEWYHQRLLTAPDAGPARAYLRARGYGRDIVERYKLGWAPDGWDTLARALRIDDDVLRDTGLGFVNKVKKQQDAFRARILFPIFDVGGHPVAFGGRKLPDGEGPKYKNSSETLLYSKSRILYGLNWAKADVVSAGEVVVCEGYTDVIAFAQAGVPRAVATCGTALADEHFRILKNFARRVVLAYDADAAGQAAAERFYEWERRYEVDIAVAALPPGSDPADVVRNDPALLEKAVEQARPFLSFRVERVLAAADLRTAEGRARAAESVLGVIREHPSDFVRDQYVMEVADRTRIDPDRLRARLAEAPPPVSSAGAEPSRRRRFERPEPPPDEVAAGDDAAVPAPRRARRASEGPELEALRLAIHRPEAVAAQLHEVLFRGDVELEAFRALASATTLHDAIAAAGPDGAALLQRLAVEESEAEPVDVLALLVRRAATAAVADVQAQARVAQDPLQHEPTMSWLKQQIEALGDPHRSLDAVEQLVAWLADRLEEQA